MYVIYYEIIFESVYIHEMYIETMKNRKKRIILYLFFIGYESVIRFKFDFFGKKKKKLNDILPKLLNSLAYS